MDSVLSDTRKQSCTKCAKDEAVTTCHECQQIFCSKHFAKHRQQISQRMEDFNQKQALLQQDLKGTDFGYSLLTSIYAWERKSMRKIQEIAEQARNDLQEWIDQTKNDVRNSLNQINEQLQSSVNAGNYTEVNIHKWNKRLKELRNLLEKPTMMSFVEDDNPSTMIRTIKMVEKQPISQPTYAMDRQQSSVTQKSISFVEEHFVQMYGPSKLSNNNRVVTHSSYRAGLSQVSGSFEYSLGKHFIDLLIEKKGEKNMFLGIHSSAKQTTLTTFDYSVHGWWNLDHTIVNGESKSGESNDVIKTNDRIKLIIDCDQQQIQLEHQRTKRLLSLPIDLAVCPFPWKMLVRLLTPGDCLHVLC